MKEILERFNAFEPYSPEAGEYKIRLDANESFISPDKNYMKKIQARIKAAELNRYPDPSARTLISCFSKYYFLKSDCVTAFNGSDEAIALIISALTTEDDEMLVLSNDFSMYIQYAKTYNRQCTVYEKDGNMDFELDEIAGYINENGVKLFIFSNPCNPTSKSVTKNELKRFISKVDALVVIDEAYMDFDNESLLSEIQDFENLIILKTASKALGLAAVRLGFAVASQEITNILRAVKSPYNVNLLTQIVGEEMYKDKLLIKKNITKILSAKKEMIGALISIKSDSFKLFASNANFFFIEFSEEDCETVFSGLKEKGILVRKLDNFLRVTVGDKKENAVFIKAFANLVSDIQKTAINNEISVERTE